MVETSPYFAPDGYSMQETGQIPYNPFNEQYGLSSPYADFMMAGYNPDDTSWQTSYEENGMGAFDGTGIEGYDPELDASGGYDFSSTDNAFDPYDPNADLNDWTNTNQQTPSPPPDNASTAPATGPGPALPEPPMPPWMSNLAEGKAYGPWSLIYNNPTPFASKEQWTNMNDSERRGLIGSLPEYMRQDYMDNMQKAFIPGVDKNSAQGFIA